MITNVIIQGAMKNKKIIVILCGIIVLIALAIFLYLKIFHTEVSGDCIVFTNYPGIEMDDEAFNKINKGVDNKEDLDEVYTLDPQFSKNRGNVFAATVYFNVKRPNSKKDYYVGTNVDFSALSDSEKIFWGTSMTSSQDKIFVCNWPEQPDKMEMKTWCMLYGVTAGKTSEEIKNIIKKLKFTLILEDESGRIMEKKIVASDLNISNQDAEEQDTEAMKETISLLKNN